MAWCSRKLEGQWWGDGGAYFVSSDGPDNITVAPQGGLIRAEDGNGVSHLVGVTEEWVDAGRFGIASDSPCRQASRPGHALGTAGR